MNSCIFIFPKFPETVGSVTTQEWGTEEEGGYEMRTPVVPIIKFLILASRADACVKPHLS